MTDAAASTATSNDSASCAPGCTSSTTAARDRHRASSWRIIELAGAGGRAPVHAPQVVAHLRSRAGSRTRRRDRSRPRAPSVASCSALMRLPDRDRRHDLVHARAHDELDLAGARLAPAGETERIGDRHREGTDPVAAASARRDAVRGAGGRAGARAAGRGSAPRAGPRRTSRWRRAGAWPARPGSRPGGRCGPRCRRGGGPVVPAGSPPARAGSGTAATARPRPPARTRRSPSTSISSAPRRKLPTTSPIAAPSSDQPRRVRVTARVVEGPVGGPEVATSRVSAAARARHRHRRHDRAHDVVRRRRRAAAASGASMSRCSSTAGQHALHVVGDHVVAAEAGGERPGGALQRRATPRGLAPSTRSGWRRVAATRSSDVVAHLGGDVHATEQTGGVGDVDRARHRRRARRRWPTRWPCASRIASSASRSGYPIGMRIRKRSSCASGRG